MNITYYVQTVIKHMSNSKAFIPHRQFVFNIFMPNEIQRDTALHDLISHENESIVPITLNEGGNEINLILILNLILWNFASSIQ